MVWKGGDPFPTIPNLNPKTKYGIGVVKDKKPEMTPEQSQRAADLKVVRPGQRAEMNEILNTIDNTNMKIKK